MPKKIPQIKLVPQTDNETKKIVGYKYNDIAGTRHQLGGQPDGFSETDFPKCSDCKQSMTFYGQLDSIGDNYDLADCGLIQVFVCFDCFTTKSVLTNTEI